MEQNFTQSSARRRVTYEDKLTEDLGKDVTVALDKEKQRIDRKLARQLEIEESKSYNLIKSTTKWMDRYFLDGIIGLVPVVGDTFTIAFSLPFLYVSLVKIKSIPLTLAIIYNVLVDALIGLIPFFVGNIADFFFRSYKKNFELVIGFVEDDREVIKKVNKQATFLAIGILLISVAIYYTIIFVISIVSGMYDWIGSFLG